MPSSPVDRISRYIRNLDPDAIRAKYANARDTMIAKETVAANVQFELERRVKALLASENTVSVLQVGMYISFAKHVASIVTTHEGGAQVINEVAAVIAHWTARGMLESVLVRIREELFSIQAPTPPPA